MPISHTKKAVFVHIPKTAGTTIEQAMGMLNTESLYTTKYNEKYKVCMQHLYGSEIRELLPETINYFWFTIVRNPFDRLISEYHHVNSTNCRAKKFKDIDFDKFITTGLTLPVEDRLFLFDRHLEPQVKFISSDIKVYNFENLQQCFNDLHDKFKIPFFTHERKSIRGTISEYYQNKAVRDKVIEFYKEDFERFNYPYNP